MSMELPHVTLRDDSLPHQVKFFIASGSQRIYISCNCMIEVTPGGHTVYRPLGINGQVLTIEDSRAIYNNFDSHRGEFGPEDVAKW